MMAVRLLLALALLNLAILVGDAVYNVLGGFAPLLR
jgi:hypothetical protein